MDGADFSESDSGYAGSITANPYVTPTYVDFDTNAVTRLATIGNNGGASFSFNAASRDNWLSVLPSEGTVGVENVTVALTVDRGLMAPGVSFGHIDVTTDAGYSEVITARVEVTEYNVISANANGPYIVEQGSPVTFSAVGSFGEELTYEWDINGESSGFNTNYLRYVFTNTFIPGTRDVTLTVNDNDSPPHEGQEETTLTIQNVAPTVEIGGPYTGSVSQLIIFTAEVSDPGVLDTHTFRWDFNDDGIWDTDWTNSASVQYNYSESGQYIVKCQGRDNFDGIGEDTALALIDAPNVPPVSVAVIGGTLTNEITLDGLGISVELDGSGSYDSDTSPLPELLYDWREDPNNPERPVLTEDQRGEASPTTAPLSKQGVYRFHLVVNDGEYNSESSTLTVHVPGWSGTVICDGFSTRIPLWGVDVVVSNNAKGIPDGDRTDGSGRFAVDAGVGTQTATLSRRGHTENEIISIDSGGEVTDDVYFMPNYYLFSGQVLTGKPGAYIGLNDADISVSIGSDLSAKTDWGGNFGFVLPETWPLDGNPYIVTFQKTGFKTLQREIRMIRDINNQLIVLESATGYIAVSGLIISEETGDTIGNATVDFGAGNVAVSESNGWFGPINIAEGMYNVLVSCDGFEPTRNAVNLSPCSTTNINLTITGGSVIVYGDIYDADGFPVTNAEIVVHGTENPGYACSSIRKSGQGRTVNSTLSGYYDLPVSRGERMYIVSAPDMYPTIVEMNFDNHTRQDIVLIPEPGILWIIGLLELWIIGRRRFKS